MLLLFYLFYLGSGVSMLFILFTVSLGVIWYRNASTNLSTQTRIMDGSVNAAQNDTHIVCAVPFALTSVNSTSLFFLDYGELETPGDNGQTCYTLNTDHYTFIRKYTTGSPGGNVFFEFHHFFRRFNLLAQSAMVYELD